MKLNEIIRPANEINNFTLICNIPKTAMELTCLANPNPAYDLSDFPESTELTTSVGKRAPLGIELQGNLAYGYLENVRDPEDYSLPATRAAIHTYEDVIVGNDTVASSILSNNVNLIQVPENVYATHSSQDSPVDSSVLHSNASSNDDRYNSVMLLERRKPSGKYRKCGKQARDTTIVLAALMSILLSGCVIVLSVTYLQAHHDQCSCTPESE